MPERGDWTPSVTPEEVRRASEMARGGGVMGRRREATVPEQQQRCARDSDWCDGTICREWGIDCPNVDPAGLKSTCEKRPGCGCSIECKDYLSRFGGDRA